MLDHQQYKSRNLGRCQAGFSTLVWSRSNWIMQQYDDPRHPDSCAYTNVCKAQWTEAVLQRRVATFLHSHDFCHTEKCASSYCCFYKPLNYGGYLVFTGPDDNGFYLDNASLIVALNQKNSVNYVNLFTFLTNMQIITNSNSIWISWNVSKPAAQQNLKPTFSLELRSVTSS